MARGSPSGTCGFSIVELMFAVAIAGTLTAIAVPQGLRALDDYRTAAAAHYLAQRLGAARLEAIKRSVFVGLQFEDSTPDYLITTVVDGNGNGLRSADIVKGIDRALTRPDTIGAHFSGVSLGILEGVPDADGVPVSTGDGVRIGISKLLSMNPDGTSSSGTLYVHGTGRSQYAVRVLGATGRIRAVKFDFTQHVWITP
ncbi:MAG: pilus assembly FimT family protein [Vicinamibacterales bacterium]